MSCSITLVDKDKIEEKNKIDRAMKQVKNKHDTSKVQDTYRKEQDNLHGKNKTGLK